MKRKAILTKEQKSNSWLIIPAYNEEKSITKVIEELKKEGFKKLVVIDDCSKDNTLKIIKKLKIHALNHKKNMGQGAALRTGINYALKKSAKYIITFDSDGQHRVEDLAKMILPVAENKVDVTLGSRFISNKTKMPLSRRIMLKGSIIVQGVFYGMWLTDVHNGFRCFSNHAAKKIRITSNRMEHASEIIEEIKIRKLKFKEVPIIIKYTKETLEKGHGGLIQAFKILWKMILKKLKL